MQVAFEAVQAACAVVGAAQVLFQGRAGETVDGARADPELTGDLGPGAAGGQQFADGGVTFPVAPGQRVLDQRHRLRANLAAQFVNPADLLDRRLGQAGGVRGHRLVHRRPQVRPQVIPVCDLDRLRPDRE